MRSPISCLPSLVRALALLSVSGLVNYARAAQQCRLVLSGDDMPSVPEPVNPNPSNGTSDSGPGSNTTSRPLPPFPAFPYGKEPIRGVNLGGWFVLEPWITPSLFQNTNNTNIVDEYTFGELQDFDVALATLQHHWATFITEDDFIQMGRAGLTHVRIPVGYWSVPTNESVAPYIPGAWPYLIDAIGWARNNSIHVIFDLHGAPGSQNGYDNSGQRTGNPVWALNPANVSRTLDVLNTVAEELGGMVDVIELLNEIAGFRDSNWAGVARQFWQDGYNLVRNVTGQDTKVMIGDAFLGVQSWTNFLTSPAQGVVMDYHDYQLFSDGELARSQDEHVSFACTLLPTLQNFADSDIWTVTGEWSVAITDCAQWLNGRGVGARWDGTFGDGNPAFGSCHGFTGDYSTFSTSYKQFLRQYWEVQVEIGESVQGWIYWTWKAENADDWSYQKGLEGGWIPQDPSERLYPGLCNSNGTSNN